MCGMPKIDAGHDKAALAPNEPRSDMILQKAASKVKHMQR